MFDSGGRTMAVVRSDAILKQLNMLLVTGTITGVDDLQLLERFVHRRDESAFGMLMALHGPLVLRVCRSLLNEPADIEDVFQATFLVLAQKSGSLRNGHSLGHWLYKVAYRHALRARTGVHRGSGSAAASTEVFPDPAENLEQRERLSVLDEEIYRLPEKFQAPVVLCYYEGLSHEEAARRLRCPLGTVNSRLATARERLRVRLIRRGVAPSGMVVAIGSLPKSATAAVPAALLKATTKAAVGFATGRTPAAGTVSAGAASLVENFLRSLFMRSLGKFMVASLVVVGSISVVLAWGQVSDGGGPGRTPESERPGLVSLPEQANDSKEINRQSREENARLEKRLSHLEATVDSQNRIVTGSWSFQWTNPKSGYVAENQDSRTIRFTFPPKTFDTHPLIYAYPFMVVAKNQNIEPYISNVTVDHFDLKVKLHGPNEWKDYWVNWTAYPADRVVHAEAELIH
jgi:RNA polymerase sigma factor (sigma-70 family)